MDALARLEPVARGLMRQVDAALITLGAPVEHPVWSLLRRLSTTPVDAVAFFTDAQPDAIRAAGVALRQQAGAYCEGAIPAGLPWQGSAGQAYAAHLQVLAGHLGGDGPDSLAGRLEVTASYVEDVAEWYERSRDRLARTLADVLMSAQAVAVRSCPALAGTVTELARLDGQVPGAAVSAAADIGAYVLDAAADALAEGHECQQRWTTGLAELPYPAPPDAGPVRFDGIIHVRP